MASIRSNPDIAAFELIPSTQETTVAQDSKSKAPFTPPKLTFITPTLTKQGSVEKLTAGIIGTFS